jgi:hypothetical protein
MRAVGGKRERSRGEAGMADIVVVGPDGMKRTQRELDFAECKCTADGRLTFRFWTREDALEEILVALSEDDLDVIAEAIYLARG